MMTPVLLGRFSRGSGDKNQSDRGSNQCNGELFHISAFRSQKLVDANLSTMQPPRRLKIVTPQHAANSLHEAVSATPGSRAFRHRIPLPCAINGVGFILAKASRGNPRGRKRPRIIMAKKPKTLAPRGKALRSQLWWDNPDN